MFKLKNVVYLVLCLIICGVTLGFIFIKKQSNKEITTVTVLNLWQIDSFEGGKGSRSAFINKIGEKFYKQSNVYVKVSVISAESARINLSCGVVPDIISYGAGIYGLENYIFEYDCWCYGAYCFIALDESADFSDINSNNCIINSGTGNFAAVTALFCGLEDAQTAMPTKAYVDLINKKYKYLLGTQRDIFRLKTREINFKYKVIKEFNDLYQNISVTSIDEKQKVVAKNFVNFFLNNLNTVSILGLFNKNFKQADDEFLEFYNTEFEFNLKCAINKNFYEQINYCIREKQLNKLKNILK